MVRGLTLVGISVLVFSVILFSRGRTQRLSATSDSVDSTESIEICERHGVPLEVKSGFGQSPNVHLNYGYEPGLFLAVMIAEGLAPNISGRLAEKETELFSVPVDVEYCELCDEEYEREYSEFCGYSRERQYELFRIAVEVGERRRKAEQDVPPKSDRAGG